MANWATIRGIASGEEAEKCYLSGYNNTGGEVNQGEPLCWALATANGIAGNDGIALADPVTANFDAFAGIAESTIASGAYTNRLVAYGPVMARTYGVASTFVPGANLVLITGKSYLAYNSQNLAVEQRRVMTAMQTNATVDTNLTKIHVHAL